MQEPVEILLWPRVQLVWWEEGSAGPIKAVAVRDTGQERAVQARRGELGHPSPHAPARLGPARPTSLLS